MSTDHAQRLQDFYAWCDAYIKGHVEPKRSLDKMQWNPRHAWAVIYPRIPLCSIRATH